MLTRVEGHGTVELICDGERVVDVRLNLYESPRLFEALLVGRRFDEIADIACRICSICSTVHKVAALQAVEQALGVTVSSQTGLLRELAVQGGQIESHALHIFCLALPDYLGVNGVQELAACEPVMLQTGLRLKKMGNLIQEIVGGRAIHPFNLLLGGLGKVPEVDQVRFLNERLLEMRDDMADCIAYVFDLKDILPSLPMLPVCAVSGGSQLFGDRLTTSASTTVSASCATAWLNEQVDPCSHAKVSRFGETALFMVGPLARLSLSMPTAYAYHFTKSSIGSSLKARIIELHLAMGRAEELIEQLLAAGLKQERPVMVVPVKGEGTSLIEAPRGVLLHNYQFDARGICRAANIITPTAINQGAMAASLKHLLGAMEQAEFTQIKNAAEILIRCYDPCVSCAVH